MIFKFTMDIFIIIIMVIVFNTIFVSTVRYITIVIHPHSSLLYVFNFLKGYVWFRMNVSSFEIKYNLFLKISCWLKDVCSLPFVPHTLFFKLTKKKSTFFCLTKFLTLNYNMAYTFFSNIFIKNINL